MKHHSWKVLATVIALAAILMLGACKKKTAPPPPPPPPPPASPTASEPSPSGQIVVHDLAETERQVGKDMDPRYDLEHRQFGDRSQCVGMKLECAGSGPGAL